MSWASGTTVQREKMALDIFLTFHTQADHFTAQLLRLIAKADPANRGMLFKGFPLAVEMFEEWHATTPERAFYERYNVRDRIGRPESELFESMYPPLAATAKP